MSKFFKKLGQDTKKFFTKTLTDPNLFRKIGNTAAKVNNSVQRVGAFLQPLVTAYNPAAGMALGEGLATSSAISNNLERSINTPMSQIKSINQSSGAPSRVMGLGMTPTPISSPSINDEILQASPN
jgi:hypothetical protein